jgi:hypothetical protein
MKKSLSAQHWCFGSLHALIILRAKHWVETNIPVKLSFTRLRPAGRGQTTITRRKTIVDWQAHHQTNTYVLVNTYSVNILTNLIYLVIYLVRSHQTIH